MEASPAQGRSHALQLRLLGSAQLSDPEGAGNACGLDEILSQPKRLGLLSYLAIEALGGHLRRDTLLGLFWPEFESSRGRAALRRALHFLRRRLGRNVLVARGVEEVGLDATRLTCDAWSMSRAAADGRPEEVLELYGGELLPGLYVSGAPGFQHWLDRERARLRRTAVEAVSDLARLELADGRPERAATRLWHALDLMPTEESLLHQLLGCLARAGNRAAALHTYREWSRRLREEHGMRPSRPTRELHRALEHGRLEKVAEEAPSALGRPDSRVSGRTEGLERAPAVLDVRALTARELASRALALVDENAGANRAALELAEEAVRLDPDAALPRAARAEARSFGVQLFGFPRPELRKAVEDARRAVALEEDDAEAHFALGLAEETLHWMGPALRSFAAARALAARNLRAVAHFGRVVQYRGQFARSQYQVRLVAERAPVSPATLHQLGMNDFLLERREEAEEAFGRAVELRPEFPWVHAAWAYFDMWAGRFDAARERIERFLAGTGPSGVGAVAAAELAFFTGQWERALSGYERLLEQDPGARSTGPARSVRTQLGYLHSRYGDAERGHELLSQAEAEVRALLSSGADYGGLHLDLAAIHAVRGRRRAALDELERGVRAGWRVHAVLRDDPIFASLRDEPRLQALLDYIARDLAAQREALRQG